MKNNQYETQLELIRDAEAELPNLEPLLANTESIFCFCSKCCP